MSDIADPWIFSPNPNNAIRCIATNTLRSSWTMTGDRSSGGGERVADRDSLVAAHEGGLRGLGLAGQLEGLEAWHELAEQRSELDASELGAEAEMDAPSQSDVAGGGVPPAAVKSGGRPHLC